MNLVFEAGVSNSIFRESLSKFCALNVPCDDLCEFRVRHVDRWTRRQRPLLVSFFTLMLGHFPHTYLFHCTDKELIYQQRRSSSLRVRIFISFFILSLEDLSLFLPLEIGVLSQYNCLAHDFLYGKLLFFRTELM